MTDFDVASSLPVTTSSPSLALCTATVADYINATQRHLLGSHGEIINLLNANISNSVTSVVLSYATDGLGPRRVVEIDDELMYVLDLDAATKTLTVIRGYQGTTTAAHSAAAQVVVNPRYPRGSIRSALKDEINSWPESLFAIGTYDLTVGSLTRGYDLPIGDFKRIIDAYLSPATGDTLADWTRVAFNTRKLVPTASFAGGNSITFNTAFSTARTVRILYAKSFDTSSMDDAVACSTIGLAPSMSDIPPLGAAWRLSQGKEVRRLDLQAQGQNRAAEQIPVGANSGLTRAFKQLRDQRLDEERARMAAIFPFKFS